MSVEINTLLYSQFSSDESVRHRPTITLSGLMMMIMWRTMTLKMFQLMELAEHNHHYVDVHFVLKIQTECPRQLALMMTRQPQTRAMIR